MAMACTKTPQDLAQLVRERGTQMRADSGDLIDRSYEWTKTVTKGRADCTRVHVEVRDCMTTSENGERIGRMEIRIDPVTVEVTNHLPFRYEITDWSCDGMKTDFDDFRLYLGSDRWHRARVEEKKWDPLFEPVIRTGVKPMYDELVQELCRELVK